MKRLVLALTVVAATLPGRADLAPFAPLDISRLQLPPGFQISLFARLSSPPRFLLFTPSGNLLASLMYSGSIASISPSGQVSIFADGLYHPHGLALLGSDLYVAEETQVRVYRNMDASRSEVLLSLPLDGHSTRTIGFGPDGKMYVSIGSSCNLCVEADPRRAAIVRYNPDGTGQEIFARGLRNSVGFRWNPQTRELWATDNGFDTMGDDLPPEEINIVQLGGDYGWPYCYADRLVNPLFPPADPNRCAGTVPPAVKMQAHSAPLGFDFYTGSRFPADYRGDAFVAFHGSWNRTVPTGYKIVRVHVQNGVPGLVEDFITGWLQPNPTTGNLATGGRPVDVLTGPDGALYITDDQASVIYRIVYNGALLNSNGITNAASFSTSTAAAPGGLITIFGANLFNGKFQATTLPLPASIPGLAVTIGGQPAPLLYADQNQINAQIPIMVVGDAQLMVATSNGTDTTQIKVADTAPGIFAVAASTVADPIAIYATGLGKTIEIVIDGYPAPLSHVISTNVVPSVRVGGLPAEVLFSGLAPGFVGVNQVNVRVPAGIALGTAVPVVLTAGAATSNIVTITLR